VGDDLEADVIGADGLLAWLALWCKPANTSSADQLRLPPQASLSPVSPSYRAKFALVKQDLARGEGFVLPARQVDAGLWSETRGPAAGRGRLQV